MPDDFTHNASNRSSWYHCARCGSLFQSATHVDKDRRCSECGFNPNTPASDQNTQSVRFAKSVNHLKDAAGASRGQIRKSLSRKKTTPVMLRLVIIWAILTGLIVFAAKTIWRTGSPHKPVPVKSSVDVALEKENLALLNKSMGSCMQTMRNFLLAGPPEQRSQYVMNPSKAVARMTRHQLIENLTEVPPPAPDSSQWQVVSMNGEKAIETTWSDNEGRRFEAIFRKEREEWLIDWEHFARYSDMPLAVFLSGNGDAEGEFRLLARERLAEERKDLPTISIMFYAPIFGRPSETEMSSPEFLIERNSPEGVLLQAAFSELKNKKRPFNAKLANLDPEGMIRVRVKIRRSGEADSRAFKIVELKACHWYSSDLSGLDVASGSETKNPD